MSDKILTLIMLLVLSVIIGVMSWSDMHPSLNKAVNKKQAINIISGYYLGFEVNPETVPNDPMPVTVAAGIFKYKDGNNMVFVPRPMGMHTFAQRQVNLMIKLDGLPSENSKTFDKFEKVLKDWRMQGNDISAIFFDYRPKTPDLKKYAEFADAFRKKFNTLHFIPVIDISWINNHEYADYIDLKYNSTFFLVNMTAEQNTPQNIDKLNDVGYGFHLKMPQGYVSEDVDNRALVKNRYYSGAMAFLENGKIIVKEKVSIGVLPKFLTAN